MDSYPPARGAPKSVPPAPRAAGARGRRAAATSTATKLESADPSGGAAVRPPRRARAAARSPATIAPCAPASASVATAKASAIRDVLRERDDRR